jgi:hypothetical protein
MKECQETTVCHEATEADMEKIGPESGMMQSVAEHQEVPREDAAVIPVGGLRKQRRGRKQAAGRREEPKELNRGMCGSWEKLAAAYRKVSCHATVAWHKRNILGKFWTQRNCGLRKEVTAARIRVTRCAGVARHKIIIIGRNRIRRHEPKYECSKGTRSRRVEELLHLRKKRKTAKSIRGQNRRLQPRLETMRNSSNEVFRKSIGLGFGKRAAGLPVVVRKIKKWTLWRGRPPPKRKKQH